MLMIVSMACYDVTSDNWCATQPRGYIGNLEQLHSTPLQTARTLQHNTKDINGKQSKQIQELLDMPEDAPQTLIQGSDQLLKNSQNTSVM